ncbi:hypothetical protein COLO4_29976 [Corchorus olitorius]|uniref:Uncharacterized protein n=1 Tax=Corchorus olitorius TaxID=93759 RepID=A0A1R3HC14_9ROSI|nr:hypothetical protein COLO4_29976 [Corchorus olitorius]
MGKRGAVERKLEEIRVCLQWGPWEKNFWLLSARGGCRNPSVYKKSEDLPHLMG